MKLQYGKSAFRITVGSDVDRDGFYAELAQEAPGPIRAVAEAFWSDKDLTFSVTSFEAVVPMTVMERFMVEARRRVPPMAHPIETNVCQELDADP